MEGGALFNPGFLGANFLWWIGQIADDSTWRDNGIPGKFQSEANIPGWGKRYKVRIIGLHDKEETTIPSDQLPWAQVMYPITAGGGQAHSSQTPNLRHGMFVFGFFLDGQEQQVPVIMGVLGNNAQTKLEKEIGTDKSNFGPTSGHAKGKNPPPGSAAPIVPDSGKKAEDAPVSSTPVNNAILENTDAVHQVTAANVKREEKYQEKIPLMKPDDKIGSAMKCIQTVLDNITKKIDKFIRAAKNYIDLVSNVINDIQRLISNAACEIAKYIKMIFDKIMEYVIKLLNKALTKVVSAMPSSMRHMMADIKEILIELICCLYGKMTQSLCGIVDGILNGIVRPQIKNRGNCNKNLSTPNTPICYAESLVAKTLAANRKQIDDAKNNILKNLNSFLSDIEEQLAGVSGISLPDFTSMLGNIIGNISAALNFENLKLNIFGVNLNQILQFRIFILLPEVVLGNQIRKFQILLMLPRHSIMLLVLLTFLLKFHLRKLKKMHRMLFLVIVVVPVKFWIEHLDWRNKYVYN